MKTTFLIVLFLAEMFFCAAQNSKLDSMNSLIRNAKSDTARINLMCSKVSLLLEINLDSAVLVGRQAIEEARRVNYKKGEGTAQLNLSSAYCFKGDYAAARDLLNEAGKIFALLKDTLSESDLYGNMGMMYGMQSKYDSAILYYNKAMHIAEILHDEESLNSVYQNLAISYLMQSDHANAILYFQKALSYYERINKQTSQAYIYLNLGLAYNNMGDSLRGERSLLKALDLSKKLNMKNVELYAYTNLSGFYDGKDQYQEAYDYAMKAVALGRQTGDIGITATSLARAATALAELGKFQEARKLGEQAIRLADSSGQPFNIYQAYTMHASNLKREGDCAEAIAHFEKAFQFLTSADLYDKSVGNSYTDLSECYEKTGEYKKALAAYKKAAHINDSIRSSENIRKATEQNMNYEFEKKQQLARAEQEKKNEVARTRQIALTIGLALTFLLALLAFYAFRNKQKTNVLLNKQKDQIEHTLSELKVTQKQLIQSEKMASLGELTAGIAHEIQNPLNFVTNFSEVNNELIEELKSKKSKLKSEEDDEILNDIFQNNEKIAFHGKRADAIVKGMLQHSRASTGKKEPTDINALADEYLRLSYHGMRAKDKSFNAEIKTDFDNTIGKINVVPQDIGRVLLNLFNNAFYAIGERRKVEGVGYEPFISVCTKKVDNKVEIHVKDNGNGIPQKVVDKIFQPFFTTKPTGQGTGLGLSLSYDIVKAHGGEIKVETKEGEGSEFVIELAIKENVNSQ